MRSVFTLAMVVCAASTAWAQTPAPVGGAGATTDGAPAATSVAPTTPEQFEGSRKEYSEGAAAYERGAYDEALKHFEAAYALAPSPEFWFNIGRCHERLGRWAEAAAVYEKYLAGKPTVEDAVQIRERIADLKLRAQETARLTAPPPPPPPLPSAPRANLRPAAIAMLGVTVALGAGGVGTYFSEWSDYQAQRRACNGQCTSAETEGLRTRVQTAVVASSVLWALAGAALVADVTLWILDKRRHREQVRPLGRGLDAAAVRF